MRVSDLRDFFRLRRHIEDPWAFLRTRKRPPAGPFLDLRLRDGGELRLRPGTLDRHIFLAVFARDEYRLAGLPPRSLGTVIDGGAHIGTFAVRAAPIAGRVICLEPEPENFRLLLHNVSRLPEVLAVPRALSDRAGAASFFPAPDPSAGSIFPPTALPAHRGGSGRPAIPVRCLTLADVFRDHRVERCGLLKLDCEGAEHGILRAVPPDLWPRIERIRMEYHSRGEDAGATGESLLTLLAAAGFRGRLMARKKKPRSGHLFAWREGVSPP